MLKISKIFFLAGLLLGTGAWGGDEVRMPAVAGSFYPADAKELSTQIDGFLKAVPAAAIKEPVFGLIVPHAGYIYSGPTAAYAYNLIRDGKYSTVIIIGKSHQAVFKSAFVDDRKLWETPLGKVDSDTALFAKLYKNDAFHVNRFLLDREHSLEVQVPFLQRTLRNFKIFPVLLGDASDANLDPVADALYEAVKGRKDVLIIASTDLSHYYPLKTAEAKDRVFLKTLARKDAELLKEKLAAKETELCGDAAVLTLLKIAEHYRPYEINALNYATSADASGDASKVVGYAAVALTRGKKAEATGGKNMLTKEQKKKLLRLARETIECTLAGRKPPASPSDEPVFKEKRGVFVTLHKQGNLRGCIGYIMPVESLTEAVKKMAVESALRDPRFSPVTAAELKEIEIEISVLTVPRRVKCSDDIVLCRDGVIVKKGYCQGVFLPQVAEETGWSKEEFLCNLCEHKAGLPAEAWKDPSCELLTFQAEVFNERDVK